MDSSVALKNESSRIFHTLESIHRWGCISPQSQFVICDGSGFDFTNLIEERFPHLQVECIHFMNDPSLVQHYGKGYGESEIIQYALMHSRVLKNANYFAKCTAKLWVDNFIACLDEWNGRFLCKAYFSNVFSFKSASLEYIDTRFYIVDKYFYLAKLANLYVNINSNRSESIEEKFLKVLLNNNAEKFLFPGLVAAPESITTHQY
jgi:hypothetical protein